MWHSTGLAKSVAQDMSIHLSGFSAKGRASWSYEAAVPRSSPQNLEWLIRTGLAKATNHIIFPKR